MSRSGVPRGETNALRTGSRVRGALKTHTLSERGPAWPESHRRRELYHTHTDRCRDRDRDR